LSEGWDDDFLKEPYSLKPSAHGQELFLLNSEELARSKIAG
jgi:hypothetical protein